MGEEQSLFLQVSLTCHLGGFFFFKPRSGMLRNIRTSCLLTLFVSTNVERECESRTRYRISGEQRLTTPGRPIGVVPRRCGGGERLVSRLTGAARTPLNVRSRSKIEPQLNVWMHRSTISNI